MSWLTGVPKGLMRRAVLADLTLLLPAVRSAISVLYITARHPGERDLLRSILSVLDDFRAVLQSPHRPPEPPKPSSPESV